MSPHLRSTQRGAALLSAMITVALVATLAATALWRQWRGVEIEAAERTRVQAVWILNGALDWGRLILQGDLAEDLRKGRLIDHLDEPWAVPLAEARLSTFLAAGQNSSPLDRDAFLSGQIHDLQARLNLMNLIAEGPEAQAAALRRFERLFELLGLPAHELRELPRALARAQQALTGTSTGQGDAPLLPRRFEQLGWLGLSPDTLQRLAPHATVLPLIDDKPTPVNLNTASAETLQAALPGITPAQAQSLIELRQRRPLQAPQQAADGLGLDGLNLDWAAVSSAFFEIHGRLRLDDIALEETATVQRSTHVRGGRHVQILWRTRQAFSLPPPGET